MSLFYAAIQFVSIGTLPDLANSDKPLADAAFLFMGRKGAILITLGAFISVSGTLNTVMLIGGRIPFALAEEKQLPAGLAKIHPRYFTPGRSLFLFALLAFLASVSGTFIYAIGISVISKVMIFLVVSAALLRLRITMKEQKEYYKLRYGKFLALTGIALALILLFTSKTDEFRAVFITLILGAVFYVFNLLYLKKRKP